MLPNIHVLGFTLHSYDLFFTGTVAFVLVIGPLWVARVTHVDRRAVWCAAALAVAVAMMGGRVHYAATHWATVSAQPLGILSTSGRHVGGALVAFLIAAPLIARLCRLPALRCLDAAMPIVGVGVAIYRTGCFLHGCCVGVRGSWSWCLRFPPATSVYEAQIGEGVIPIGVASSLPVHPLQLYFALAALVAAAAAAVLFNRRHYDGEVTLVFVTVLFAAIAVLEPLRARGPGSLSGGQGLLWFAIVVASVAASILLVVEVARRAYRLTGRVTKPRVEPKHLTPS